MADTHSTLTLHKLQNPEQLQQFKKKIKIEIYKDKISPPKRDRKYNLIRKKKLRIINKNYENARRTVKYKEIERKQG